MKSILLAVALAFGAASASAQTIYSSVSLDGQKTFSDRPDMAPDSAAEAAPDVRSGRARLAPLSSRRGAEIDAREAARRLGEAQSKQRRGLAPLAGEQPRQVAGAESSVANRRYWQRQERLRLAVEQAQRRMDETLRPQLARR